MARLPKVIPISDLRSDAATALKSVRSNRDPVIITQRGRATAVLISIETYERGERERAMLRQLARGEREIATGKGHGLEDVLADVDAVLADDGEQ